MTDELRTRGRRRRARRQGVQPRGGHRRRHVQGARIRRQRHRLHRGSARGLGVLLAHDPPGAPQRPGDHPRHAAAGVRQPGRAHRPARARGSVAGHRQGGPPRLHRPARLRRPGRRGRDRVDPALSALAALGLRVGSGDPDRRRARPAGRHRLGAAADRPRGAGHRRLARASARRSPRCWPATAPTWSASTCRPWRPSCEEVTGRIGGSALTLDITEEGSPDGHRLLPQEDTTRASTSSSTTPASPATRRSGA